MSEVYNSRISACPGELGACARLLPIHVNGHQLMCPVAVLEYWRIPIECTEYQNVSVAIFHVDESILKEFCSWLTTGQSTITDRTVEAFAYTAFKNNLTSLLEACEQHYLIQLTKTSCLQLWVIGGSYACRILESEALKLIRENFEDIIKSKSWLLIDIHHVTQLMFDRSSNILSPEAKRKAICRWSQYDSGTRTEQVTELLNSMPVDFSSHDLNRNEEQEMRSSPSFRVICVGCTQRGLSLYEVNVERHRTLSLSKLTVKIPKEIDSQSAFQYVPETNSLLACSEDELWSLKNTGCKRLAKLKLTRSKHMICQIMDEIWVLGGYWDLKRIDYIHTYSRRKKKWSTNNPPLSLGLVSGKCVTVGSQVFMFGNQIKDENGEIHQKKMLQRLDTSRCRHSVVLRPPPFPKDSTYVETVVASPQGLIYVFSSHGDLFEYNPARGSYDAMAPLPCSRSRFGTFVLEETLYVFGGLEREMPTTNRLIKSYSLDLNHPNATWRECGFEAERVRILS